MRKAAWLLWMAGGVLAAALIAALGWREVLAALEGAGWGLLPVTLYHVLLLALFTACWGALLQPAERIPWGPFFSARWIGEAVNNLLPAGQVGGDVLRAQLAARQGMPRSIAGASVMVDVTLGLATEAIFAVIGLLAWSWIGGGGPGRTPVLLGVGLFAVLALALIVAQRRGLFRGMAALVVRLGGGRRWQFLLGEGEALDGALRAIHRRRARLAIAAAGRLLGWVLGTGEVWLALHVLGHPVSLLEALVLESLSQAARSAAFLIPGGLGVQEGGLVFLGSALGVAAPAALALSLVKRARELILGLPALVVWQWAEGRRARARRAGIRSA